MIENYLRMGMALVAIPAHEKGPRQPGWQEKACTDLDVLNRGNVGINHGLCGTCCLDVDDEPKFLAWWQSQGLSLQALETIKAHVPVWTSGRPNRWKALFRAPEGLRTLALHGHGFEIRAAGGQDVLPPSVVVRDDGSEWHYHWLSDIKPLDGLPLFPRKVLELARATPKLSQAAPSTLMAAMLDAVPEGGRNDYLSSACYAKIMQGVTGEQLVQELRELNEAKCIPPVDDAELLAIVRNKERAGVEPTPEAKAANDLQDFMPPGYRVHAMKIEQSQRGEDGEDHWVPFLDYCIAVTNVIRIPGVQEQRYLEITVQNGGEAKHHLTMQQLSREAEVWLNNIGISCFGKKALQIKAFLIASKEVLEMRRKVTDSYKQFGWQVDGSFLVGDRIYRKGEQPRYVHLESHAASLARFMPLQGDWRAWAKAVRPILDNELQRFAFVMSLSAVLMQLTGERGGVFSMVGPSGQGKSTVQAAVASVFGSVESAFSKAQDTENARIAFLSVMHNLPVQAEELTKLGAEKLAVLAYDVSEGRDKRRLDKSGGMREMAAEWHTILTSSSNAPIIEKLLDTGATAEAYRVLEMRVVLPSNAKMQDGDRMKRECLANAGAAGHVIAQYLVDHRDIIATTVEAMKERIQTAVNGKTDERIRINMVAAAVVMASILNKALSLEIDVPAVARFGVQLIQMERVHTRSFDVSMRDILTYYINENMEHCIQANKQNVVTMMAHTKAPYLMRYDAGTQRLLIDVRSLRRYVLGYRVDWTEFKRQLHDERVVMGESRILITKGCTGIPPQGSTMCLNVNAAKLEIDFEPKPQSQEAEQAA